MTLRSRRPRQIIDWSYDGLRVGIHVHDPGKEKIKDPREIHVPGRFSPFTLFPATPSPERERVNHLRPTTRRRRRLTGALRYPLFVVRYFAREAINRDDSHGREGIPPLRGKHAETNGQQRSRYRAKKRNELLRLKSPALSRGTRNPA